MYLIEGPQKIANHHGYPGFGIPKGMICVVEDGPYVNGGMGPIAIAHRCLFHTKEEANDRIREIERMRGLRFS